MNQFTTLFIFVAAFGLKSTFADQKCPIGQFTKGSPSKEDNMHACKIYSCNSCCHSNLTEQLVLVPLQMVGAWNYSQCGRLSELCSQFFSFVNCYYQCSPNLYPWLAPKTNRLHKLPVCGGFCDDWYEACKADKTCVRGESWNSLEAFKKVPGDDGVVTNQCLDDQPCRTYARVYNSSKNFCNKMWKDWVEYTDDMSSCIIPGDMNHNEEVIKKKEGNSAPFSKCEEVHYTDAGVIVAVVFGVLAGLTLIVGLAIFIVRRRRGEFVKQPKGAPKDETATAKEMEELNPSTLE